MHTSLGLDVVATAREYLGTKFHHQGRKKGVGIDCVGLLVCVAKEHNLNVIDSCEYSRRPAKGLLLSYVSKVCTPIPIEDLSPGDIIVFKDLGLDWAQHIGLRTDRGVLHTYATVGKVVEHELSGWWMSRIDSAWRYTWPQ